jgi:hypothetical protein
LLTGTAHPEICLTVANDGTGLGIIVIRDSEIHVQSDQHGHLDLAVWLYSVETIGVLVHYVRGAVKMEVAGHAWHPSTARKIVRMSPPMGSYARLARGGAPVTRK